MQKGNPSLWPKRSLGVCLNYKQLVSNLKLQTHTVDDASQLFSLKTSLHTSLLACSRDKVRQSKQIMNFPISVQLQTVGHSVTARWTLIAAS